MAERFALRALRQISLKGRKLTTLTGAEQRLIRTISRRRPRCARSGDRKPSKQRFVVRSGDRNWQAGSVSLAA